MKSHFCFTPVSAALPHGRDTDVKRRERRQQRRLLGVSILLILFWMIGAIWLISVRRGERSTVEILARQERIAALFPAERVRSR